MCRVIDESLAHSRHDGVPLSIPGFRPHRYSLSFSLLLLLALLLLVLTGLGVFRLYFDFDWTAGDPGVDQVFSLRVLGGSAFNLFEAEPLGDLFWQIRLITLCLLIALPWFRPAAALVLAALAALAVIALHRQTDAVAGISVEFELLSIALIVGLHVTLAWYAEARGRQQVAGLLSQYVPAALVDSCSAHPDGPVMTGEQREVSIMFCDIVDFSRSSEELEPAALAGWLNGFFELVSGIVVRHGGTIDKYIGDSVMAIWGAPEPSAWHAAGALDAARDIQREIVALSRVFEQSGTPPMRVGIGISTGLANVGTLGSVYRRDYTAVGDAVNVAQRLEQQTRHYGVPIIVSDGTMAALSGQQFRELDTVQIKGRRQPVVIYAPLCTPASQEAHDPELHLHDADVVPLRRAS